MLRNLIRQKDTLLWPDRSDLVHHLSIVHSMPAWLVDKLMVAYGADMAEDILKSPRPEDHVMVRYNRLRMPEEQFVQWLDRQQWRYQKGTMPGAYKIYGVAHMAAHEGFREGLFTIQGEGSMAAAEATGWARHACAGLLSAPGSRPPTWRNPCMIPAASLPGTSTSTASNCWRRWCSACAITTWPELRDAMTYWEQFDSDMDVVLLDAPCSGMGCTRTSRKSATG